MESLSFTLRPVPPFRLDLTAWALRRRSHNIVDRWDGTEYRRVLVPGDEPLVYFHLLLDDLSQSAVLVDNARGEARVPVSETAAQ